MDDDTCPVTYWTQCQTLDPFWMEKDIPVLDLMVSRDSPEQLTPKLTSHVRQVNNPARLAESFIAVEVFDWDRGTSDDHLGTTYRALLCSLTVSCAGGCVLSLRTLMENKYPEDPSGWVSKGDTSWRFELEGRGHPAGTIEGTPYAQTSCRV